MRRSPGERRRQRGGKASADGHHVTQLSARATWSRHPPPPIPAPPPPPPPARDLNAEVKAFDGSTPPAPVRTRAGKGGRGASRRPRRSPRGRFSRLRHVRLRAKGNQLCSLYRAGTRSPSPPAPRRTKKALYALEGLINITSQASGTCKTIGWQYRGVGWGCWLFGVGFFFWGGGGCRIMPTKKR